MGRKRIAIVASAVLFASCVHDERSKAKHYHVSGKAWFDCDRRPATGKKVRLVESSGEVLAEDTVGLDGSFLLQPRGKRELKSEPYLEAGVRRTKLGSGGYASWMHSGNYEATVTFACGEPDAVAAPAVPAMPPDAGHEKTQAADRPPAKPPSSKLLPHGYLGMP
ncbi:MAG: hypothetical protein ACYC8T_16640 [Myxococcaceae bacterium]